MIIDEHTINTLRTLADHCGLSGLQPAMEPETLTALLDRLEKAETKLEAIGKLCPTRFDDREQLLGAITRILRGEMPDQEDAR